MVVTGLLVSAVTCAASRAQAACGSVNCFIVIGSEQQVSPKGLLTVNLFYNYTPMRLLPGTSGIIPGVDQQQRKLILDHHQETRTISQSYTLDLNYGLTDRVGIEVLLPVMFRHHHHTDDLGEANGGAGSPVNFYTQGIGDTRVTLKYNALPTLRSMTVFGFGVDIPTGNHTAPDSTGLMMESSTQLGKGQAGLIGSVYQSYELIPHRLNQFVFASYRHAFRNNYGYQFGDEYLFNVGANLVTVPWLILSGQFNYRYLVHDNMSASLEQSLNPGDPGYPGDPIVLDPTIKDRPVPTTGSTYLAYSQGFLVKFNDTISAYFYAQIPIARDNNNNLAQGTSYVVGVTKYFPTPVY